VEVHENVVANPDDRGVILDVIFMSQPTTLPEVWASSDAVVRLRIEGSLGARPDWTGVVTTELEATTLEVLKQDARERLPARFTFLQHYAGIYTDKSGRRYTTQPSEPTHAVGAELIVFLKWSDGNQRFSQRLALVVVGNQVSYQGSLPPTDFRPEGENLDVLLAKLRAMQR
jgi:hypothetical protein